MRTPRSVRVLFPVLALAGLTACGTTVPVSSRVNASGQDLGGVTDPGGTSSTSTTGTTDLPSSSATTDSGSTGSTSGTSSTTGGSAPISGTTGSTTGTTGTTAPVTTTTAPVKVGMLYESGVDQVASAIGVDGLSTGDAVAQTKALVSAINAQGGLGGRKIVLSTADVPASKATDESAWQAACTALTEDQKVSWVVSYGPLNGTRLACYAKHGVPIIDDQSGVSDGDGKKYGSVFLAPGEMAPGRSAVELVDALWRTGWLNAKSKVGTLVYDNPSGVEIETKYLVPALAKHGLKPAATARPPLGAGAADQSGTAVKFRSSGVDRVIPIGASPLFLMTAAESQGYRPKYAMTSLFGPGALLEGTAPKNQLKGSAGIGWSKYLDIGAGAKPGPVSSNETRCFAIMKAAGQQSSSSTVQAFEASMCSVFFVLQDGAAKHGLLPNLFTTLRAEGFAPKPADAFSIKLTSARPDGVAAYRDLAYQDGCGCFQYTSGNRPTS